MSLFKVLRNVLDRMDNIRIFFFFEKDRVTKRKMHLMRWSEVVKQQHVDGLGMDALVKNGHC